MSLRAGVKTVFGLRFSGVTEYVTAARKKNIGQNITSGEHVRWGAVEYVGVGQGRKG